MKKSLRWLVVLVLSVSMVAMFSFGGCKKEAAPAEEEVAEEEAVEEEQKTFGIALSTLQITFFQAEKKKLDELAAEKGIDLVYAVCELDANKQLTQIEDFISKGVDAVIVLCQDSKSISNAALKCREAGIPIIAMGKPPENIEDFDATVRIDGVETARVAADAMNEAAKKQGYDKVKVIECIGDLNDQNAIMRTEGFVERAGELEFEIAASIPTEWNAELCYENLNTAVQSNPDINAVYAPSDYLLSPVMQVLEQHEKLHKRGEDGHVIVVTVDGDPRGVQSIKEGYLDADVNTDAFTIAKLSFEAALDVLDGKPVDKEIWVPNVPLTIDNIDDFGDEIWGVAYSYILEEE